MTDEASGPPERGGAEGGRRQPNRLIDATSPYLLQHAYNPVAWNPWGAEALERARREDKPIFLSIGYSACHWCHVMEREVFENPRIAAIMNEHFVNIKVDREERPDLDELYMLATQIMTGSGGWPMSVWLTPGLEPFYAGTYFPPEDGHGRPGFARLELALADAWKQRREEIVAQSKKVVEGMQVHADESAEGGGAGPVDLKAWFAGALEQFADRFDAVHGGLGGAPKFPPHQALHLWLAMLRHPNAAQVSPAGVERLQGMVTRTLDAMMNGGIYDQVGGGFARYSTDERWLVPHFEKMLYDNAQLACVYALAAAQFHRGDYARIARQTVDFWLREMTGAGEAGAIHHGGFFSSLDADSQGAEGKFYVWTLADIHAALPAEGSALIVEHFAISGDGNWHESPVRGGNVLAIARPVEDLAESHGIGAEAMRKRIDGLLVAMREFRHTRVGPGLDDKVLTSWNGLMISALAICGRVLQEPRYLEAAHRAMGFLLTEHMEGGRRLLRVSRRGAEGVKAHTAAFLEDHAFLLNGLMDLVDSTLPTSLPGTMARKRALELADTLIREFQDAERGGFFFTGAGHDEPLIRMKNAADNATPSPNGVAVRALLRLAQSSGREHYRETAMRAVYAFSPHIGRRPDFFPTVLQALVEDAEAGARHPGLARREAGPVGRAEPAAGGSALPIALAAVNAAAEKSVLRLAAAPVAALRDGSFDLRVELSVAEGYHIQSNRPADREGFATVARLRGELPLALQQWDYPRMTAGEIGYSGVVILTAHCRVAGDAAAGKYMFRVTVLAQPCTAASCLAPEKVSVDFPVVVRAG